MVEKIFLRPGERFISLAKMPRMLADAMNPAPAHRVLNYFTKSIGELSDSLSKDDFEKLLKIWRDRDLQPPPENPTEQQLEPYFQAANNSEAIKWKLGAVYKDHQYKRIHQIAVLELKAEIEKAIKEKQLTAVWPHNRIAVDQWNDTALVSVEELSKYAAKKGIDVDFERPQTLEPLAPAPVVTEQAGEDGIDFAALASPTQLIETFGRFTGMDASWFDKWADYPVLKNAIKVKGTSGVSGCLNP